ncbi:MAG: GNAT family N-acetyltransferase [Clostridiales bacterium]|jgi:ribosomal protein S18 acetylase RimI-like enzyme|nr:GNAT family N-acetyltransferase [Clostridiales bacterium]
MEIKLITENKKQFLDLLLLADEQEDMIDKYLDRGDLYVLYDGGPRSSCVVTREGEGIFEIQNLATYEAYQRMGYGRRLIDYVCEQYAGRGNVMYVGTGNVPAAVSFYERSGFVFSHTIENFFADNYRHPMHEDGILLKDKVFLKREYNQNGGNPV